jgi:hypothetical protein
LRFSVIVGHLLLNRITLIKVSVFIKPQQVIVFAQEWYGIFPLAEFALLVGVKRKDVPPGIGTLQDVLAKYRLTGHA